MCGITFRRTDENLRPVFKKNFFSKYWAVFAFFTFKFSKSIHCTFSEMKTFFLQIWRMGYKKFVFSYRTNFKNVNLNLILLKSAPKTRFSRKNYVLYCTVQYIHRFSRKNCFANRKIGLWAKLFWAYFLLRSNVRFWNH